MIIFTWITAAPHSVVSYVLCFTDGVDAKMDTVLGEMAVELDGRFSMIRNTETNLGTWCLMDLSMYDIFIDNRCNSN